MGIPANSKLRQKACCLVCGKRSLRMICAACAARLKREALHDVILDVKEGRIHTTPHD